MLKKVALIHNTEFRLDSRAQKEVRSLMEAGYYVIFCGWNKSVTSKNQTNYERIGTRKIRIDNICVSVQHGKGFKENVIQLIKYELKILRWLFDNRKNYCIIHACNMDTALPAVIIKKFLKKKVIYDIYDDYADCHVSGKLIYKIIKKVDRFVIRHADVVIICSEKRKKQLSEKPHHLEIIHNAPNLTNIDKGMKLNIQESGRLKIAYVGNLIDGRLIKELVSIVSNNPKLELHIGGSGELEKFVCIASKKYNNIYFYGRLQYDKVLGIERECDVIPALYDPEFRNHFYAAPNKFYEAMGLGKPTIMVHHTGMDEIVEKYNTGLTIEYTEKSLGEAMENILNNRIYWKEQENRLKEIFDSKYSWKIMEKRLIEIYENL